MSEKKKTLYHGELREMGQVSVKIVKDHQKSKFSGKPDYAVLEVAGEERYYVFENEACQEFFRGHTGRTFVIQADGARDKASIAYIGDQDTEPEPDPEPEPKREPAKKPAPPAPKGKAPPPPKPQSPPPRQQERPPAQQEPRNKVPEQLTPEQKLLRVRCHAARVVNAFMVAYAAATHAAEEVASQFGKPLSESQFQALTSTILIQLEKDGMHHMMPTLPVDVRPKKAKAEPSDNDGANVQ